MSLYHTGQSKARWHYSGRQKPHHFTRASFRTESCSVKNDEQQKQKWEPISTATPLADSQKAAEIMRTWSLSLLLPVSAGCREGCKGRQDRASLILCLWIIPLADPQAETFYIHITDGQRQRSSRRCSFSIYPKHRQTGAGCLGCYRHPAPSGKLLVIAWLLVCFSPPSLKGLWYLQKSHSYLCCAICGNTHFFRDKGDPVQQKKSGSFKITSVILCCIDSIPSSSIWKAILFQYP